MVITFWELNDHDPYKQRSAARYHWVSERYHLVPEEDRDFDRCSCEMRKSSGFRLAGLAVRAVRFTSLWDTQLDW